MATDPYEAAAEAPAAPSSPPVQEPPLLTFAEAMEAVDRGEAVAEVARLRGALEQAGEEFMTLHGSCRCENESPETCGCAGDGLDEEGGSIEGGCWKCYGAYLTHVAAGTWDEPAPLPLLTFAEAMDALVAGRDVEQRQYDGSWLPLASAQDMNRSQAKPTAEQLAKDARATYRLGSGSGKKGDSTE